jgi:hypothetical protein
MPDIESEILVSKIEEAFESGAYPGDDNIVEKTVNVPEEIQAAFEGKSWKEISIATTYRFRLDLPSFTPAAFRYYLPAFLIASLRSDPETDDIWYGEVEEYTFYNLIPLVETSPFRERFVDRMQGFNQKQKEAIKEFIRIFTRQNPYDREHYGRRIEEFWGSDIWGSDN